MRIRNRRLSVRPYAVGVVIAVCVASAVAWRSGWLPIELGAPDTGELAEHDDDSFQAVAERFGYRQDGNRRTGGTTPVDPTIFETQTEPEVAEGVTDLPEPRPSDSETASDAAVDWDGATARSMPDRFPSADEAAERSGEEFGTFRGVETAGRRSVQPPDAGAIRQVSNEVSRDDGVNGRPAERTAAAHVHDAAPRRSSRPAAERVGLEEIDRLIERGDYIDAHRELSKIYWGRPEMRETIQRRIDTTALSIYFSPQPHYMPAYEVQPNDQLRLIARKYHVPWEYLAKLNRTDPRKIRPGQKLKVIKGPFSVYVDLSEFELTVHAHGYYVRRYRVGVGKDGTSPIGKFAVLKKVADPTYYGPDGEVIPHDDPSNPLGDRWIDIGDSFGIHGTIDPDSIGKAESKGCIRMLNSDVQEVYDLLDVGSEVIIRR